MRKAVEIADLKRQARKNLPKLFWDYIETGSYSGASFRANEEALAALKLRQKVMVDVSKRDLSTALLGEKASLPLAIAPTGLTGMFWPDGEMRAAEAAEAFGVPYVLSTHAVCSIEDIASVRKTPFWFQLYVMTDRDFVEGLIDRARAANCSALVLTVDLPVLGQRHNDIRNGLSTPPRFIPSHLLQLGMKPAWCLRMLQTRRWFFRNIFGHVKGVHDLATLNAWANEQQDASLTWNDIGWIRKRWGGKLIIKGILDADDARAARDQGADAVVVSNHGGRQLDHAPAPIEVLPEIVDAVGSQIEVYMDGGIRSGADILKALALGAKGVLAGRAALYGLAAGGRAGVTRSLEILRDEFDTAMALTGRRSISEIDRTVIYR